MEIYITDSGRKDTPYKVVLRFNSGYESVVGICKSKEEAEKLKEGVIQRFNKNFTGLEKILEKYRVNTIVHSVRCSESGIIFFYATLGELKSIEEKCKNLERLDTYIISLAHGGRGYKNVKYLEKYEVRRVI